MADVHTRAQRSRNMAAIRSKNTKPEIEVRSLLHRLGFRFRIHRNDLPGRPDIVLPAWRTVVFVHGCFWHMHHCKWGMVKPKNNAAFWTKKRKSNVRRDKRVRALLAREWRVITVWACEVRHEDRLRRKLLRCIRCA
jgi:DNA mismatch endonuclease, patch repair protein